MPATESFTIQYNNIISMSLKIQAVIVSSGTKMIVWLLFSLKIINIE